MTNGLEHDPLDQLALPGLPQTHPSSGSWADMSDCGTYRYTLGRRWARGPVLTFLMLNPSTADSSTDDPTLRRCVSFATREGCGAIVVVNLFAYRATKPAELYAATDPIGPDNDTALIAAFRVAREHDQKVVAAWGAHPAATARTTAVLALPGMGTGLHALGTTSAGHPRHPLYVRGDTPLAPWSPITGGPSRERG